MQKPEVSCKYVEKVAINAVLPLEAACLANYYYRFCPRGRLRERVAHLHTNFPKFRLCAADLSRFNLTVLIWLRSAVFIFVGSRPRF